MLPPVDSLVEEGREGLQSIEVNLLRDDSCWERSELAMDLRREAQHELEGTVESVRVKTGVQINRAGDQVGRTVEETAIQLHAVKLHKLSWRQPDSVERNPLQCEPCRGFSTQYGR